MTLSIENKVEVVVPVISIEAEETGSEAMFTASFHSLLLNCLMISLVGSALG